MALDRSKVLETAQKHLAKGHYARAIAEYHKLVEADPNDVRTWLKIGDLYTRQGSRRDACDTYGRVAQQYKKQGFFRKAVAVYKQILKLDPSRLDILVSLAEMYEHLQLVSDALITYETVAASYARQGDTDLALDTLDRMVNLDPENIPIRIKYAEALSKAGRTPEAANAFATGATLLKKLGRIDDYIKVAERLLYHRPDDIDTARELAQLYLDRRDPKRALSKLQLCFKADPRNVPTLLLLARAFQVLGQIPKTISVYKEIARIHQTAGRLEERAIILREILELDPNDAETKKALESYAPGPARKVPEPPPSAVVRAPEPPEDEFEEELELIEEDSDAEIILSPEEEGIQDADEDDVVIAPDDDDIDGYVVAESLPPRAASNVPAAAILNSSASPSPQSAGEGREPSVEIIVEDSSAGIPASVRSHASSVPPTRSGSASEVPSVPPEVAREAHIARLLTECDVFQRYGLRAKVIDQLIRVLELAPENVEARERLKDAYVDVGQLDDAIEQLYQLAQYFEQDRPQVAHLYYSQIVDLAPESEPARTKVALRTSQRPPSEPPAVEEAFADNAPTDNVPGIVRSPVPDADDRQTDVDLRGDAEFQPHAFRRVQPDPEAGGRPTTPDPLENYGAPQQWAQEADPVPLVELRADDSGLAPMPPKTSETPAADDARLAPMSPAEFEAAPLEPVAPDAANRALERAALPPGEIEEILDEVDFFVAQGLFDEARGTLNETLLSHRDHPLVLDKIAEVAELERVAAASQPPAPSEEDAAFLLAEKLAEELQDDPDTADGAADQLDVESVFAQFKKGVEEQIGADDTDTHFDLGIAYKEMGLLDDAINEFELARASAARECIASTMIGLCYVEKGEFDKAVESFKAGLYATQKTEREELGLYFELGMAFELMNRTTEAIEYFHRVHRQEPDFRGVAEKLERLRRGPAVIPGPPRPPRPEDVDRAFDDLMGED